VVVNLAVNARDAMPNGGALTIAALNATIERDGSPQGGVVPGDYVEIAVIDTGIGMAPDLLTRVFEPFFTTKTDGKGTGLGLAQVYGFAQQTGGTAWVESREGEGTTVRLLLPRSKRQAEPVVPQPFQEPAPEPEGPLRVLVVEDDDAVAAVVLELLGQLGHHAKAVGTVAAALTTLAEPGQIDLVLSDVLLPGGDSGLDLAREVHRRQLRVPSC